MIMKQDKVQAKKKRWISVAVILITAAYLIATSAVGYAADLAFGAGHGGKTSVGELGLPVRSTGLMLPCGAAGRWTP
jgi:hypothetical protein